MTKHVKRRKPLPWMRLAAISFLLTAGFGLAFFPAPPGLAQSHHSHGTSRPVPRAPRGWIGVALREVQPGKVIIAEVLRGSPAFVAKLQSKDRLLRVGNKLVRTARGARRAIASHPAGSTVHLTILRGSKPRKVTVRLAARPNPDQLLRMRLVGLRAPRLRGLRTAMNTKGPTNADFKGKVLVVDFWASWCPPCRLTARHMNGWYKRYHGKGLEIIGVAGESVAAASAGMDVFGMNYRAFADPDLLTVRGFHVSVLPSLVIIDRKGMVRDATVGFDPQRLQEMEVLVQKLLAEKPPEPRRPARKRNTARPRSSSKPTKPSPNRRQ